MGTIFVLHVVMRGETHDEITENARIAREMLEDLRVEGKTGIPDIVTIVRIGSPTDEIIRVAEEEDISVICMTSHGKGFFRELLGGSTSIDVVRRAKRPVLCCIWENRLVSAHKPNM
jgi:nucleotide-binding universal stress UspA family protein